MAVQSPASFSTPYTFFCAAPALLLERAHESAAIKQYILPNHECSVGRTKVRAGMPKFLGSTVTFAWYSRHTPVSHNLDCLTCQARFHAVQSKGSIGRV